MQIIVALLGRARVQCGRRRGLRSLNSSRQMKDVGYLKISIEIQFTPFMALYKE
jgi:hypothetical protein